MVLIGILWALLFLCLIGYFVFVFLLIQSKHIWSLVFHLYIAK